MQVKTDKKKHAGEKQELKVTMIKVTMMKIMPYKKPEKE